MKGSPFDLLRDVGFRVARGEVLGLVGESGSGKTIASLATIGLLPPGIELRRGSVLLEGEELVADGEVSRRPGELTMIFQNPVSSLNPTMRVGKQVGRVLELQGFKKSDASHEAIDMLSRVGIPGPERVARAYPHQLSGGMCQRVMIAMALACRAKLLIADEATTALDVTIQAQIFDLIRDLVAETSCGVLFITHDLGAVAEMCDRVAVMYGGQVMETATKAELLRNPRHPYTQFLLESVERDVDPHVEDPGVNFALRGCRFGHRCPFAFPACADFPPLYDVGADHQSACFLHAEEPVGAP
ncbi:MAG: ABC transporter ATP-binding protein [Acidimicrobiia bacterium]